MNRHKLNSRDDSRPEESPRNYSKKETTDQTVTSTGKVARPVPPTTTFKAQPPPSRGGRFQEEELDSKPPAVPHFLQDDLNTATVVALEDNFQDGVSCHDNESVDDSLAYKIEGAAKAHDDKYKFHDTKSAAIPFGKDDDEDGFTKENDPKKDIETAVGGTEPPTMTTQAPLCPGAFREGGGPQDDEETLFAAPEQSLSPPQSSTPDNVITEAKLVGDEQPDLVVADVAPQEKWYTKPRNVRILIAAVVLLLVLLGVLGAVVGISGGGRSSEGDNVDVENDVCEDAISLIIPSSVQGSTMNAASDVRLPCGKSSPGVWYSILGMGNTITASLCNEDTTFDTYLAVFSVDCSRLECVVENDDGDGDSCGGKSDVSWKATDGVAYYVLVHGASSSAIGDFRLDISQADPVENNVCEDASALSIPSSVEGSTMNAGSDPSLPCGKNTPGVWYSIVGTGNTITASLCNDATTFNTNLAVFSGSCGSLECVVENEDGGDACGGKSRVSWVATDGETYSVLVHGASRSAIGDFHLDISEIDGNDFCEDAIPLSIPSSVKGSTMNATLDDVGAGTPCESRALGIWYTVVGTGNNIIASTCNNVTSYDTAISVFRGGCSGLQCVAHNYGGPESLCYSSSGWGSRAVWTSVRGETYLVLVHGYDREVGDFRLDLSQVDPVENDVCEDAIPLTIPSSIEGSTTNATLDDVGTDYPCEPYAPGIWYTVEGTGNNIIASTCNEDTSYDTKISVFRGGCSGLQCVAFNSWGPESLCDSSSGSRSRAVWTSVRGETYLVLVHGGNDREVGDFRLDLSEIDPVENDVCEDATPLSIPSSVQGSTMNATIAAGLPCGKNTPGVWYSIVGTGNTITASLCNEDTTFDTYLAVFSGSCGSLECVIENDDGDDTCGVKSRVSWTATRGVTYYILVQGYWDDDAGDFRLDIS